VASYRRVRRRVFRVFGGPITPVSLARVAARKSGLTRLVRAVAFRVLPGETIDRIRRRRLFRTYLKALSHELVPDRNETSPSAGVFRPRDAFYARVVHEDLERTDAVWQALDRRIQAVSARATERLQALRQELDLLEHELDDLEEAARGRAAASS
jgi:hypothetical protein